MKVTKSSLYGLVVSLSCLAPLITGVGAQGSPDVARQAPLRRPDGFIGVIDDDDDSHPVASGDSGAKQNPGKRPAGFIGVIDDDEDDDTGSVPPIVDGGDERGCPVTRAPAPKDVDGLVQTTSPSCPNGDGKLYQSPDGATFFIQCCTQGPGSAMQVVPAANFKACMDECSKTKDCYSAQYTDSKLLSNGLHECTLFQEGSYSSTQSSPDIIRNFAFLVDPPAIESLETANVLCSTECPYADGLQYVTSFGEAFRLDCHKRHGTQIIYRDTKESLKDCVEACGELIPCHSVDYDTQRKICYYGNHHGAPTISAVSFASARSMGCAGACSRGSGEARGDACAGECNQGCGGTSGGCKSC